MSILTTRLGMSKPEAGDTDWDEELNGNFDILDSMPGVLTVTDETARLALTGNWAGRLVYQADDKRIYKFDGADWYEVGAAVGTTRGIAFNIPATLEADQTARLVVPCALTITKVMMSVSSAPVGASIIVDVHKVEKGSSTSTTIFTTQANRPAILAGAFDCESAAPDINSVAPGDTLEIYVDQVGSTVAGEQLACTIICEVV